MDPLDASHFARARAEWLHIQRGRVITCEAPQRIVFTWQIAPDRSPQPDPDKASELEVAAWPHALESFAATAAVERRP